MSGQGKTVYIETGSLSEGLATLRLGHRVKDWLH